MSAGELTIERTVAADPEAVWAVLSDIEHASDTLSGVTRIEMLSEGPYGVGTRWRETRKMFGKEATEELYVTEADAPHRTVVESDSSGVHYVSVFTLTPADTGTHLTMTFSGTQTSTTVLSKAAWALLGRVGLKAAGKAMTKDLDEIAARAEG